MTHPALDYELQPFKLIGMALLTGLVIVMAASLLRCGRGRANYGF